MSWQDIVFSVGSWFFVAALLPSVLSSDKPSLFTSLPTAIILSVFAFAHYSLGLVVASVSTAVTALVWLVLFVQKLNQQNLSAGTAEK